MSEESTFTVGDLRREIQGLSDDTKLSFEGGLTFGRLKHWGDDEFVLLFAEPIADLPDDFKKKNPHLKVAFININDVQWDESGIVGGPIDVSLK